MTVEIKLTQGFVAIVDDEDADLAAYRWRVFSKKRPYALRTVELNGKETTSRLHREILERVLGRALRKNEVPDHINRDMRDNRRCNLRPATQGQNLANRPPFKNNASGVKGVSWDKRARKWKAMVRHESKPIYLGLFVSLQDAARAYNAKATELYGEFAYLNPLEDLAGDAVHTAETGND